MSSRALRLGSLAAVAALTLSACGGVKTGTGGGGEQGGYPSGSVEMVVGASAGGSSDLISRAVSKGLSDELGAAFPVVNREGANGALAAAEVASAPADGSKIAIQNASLFAITPLAVAEDEATTLEPFDVVHGISRDDYVMVTNPESGLASVDDLEGSTETIRFGTTGVGTGSQLAAELLFNEAGIESQAVPFDGGSPTLNALLGNQVDVAAIQVGEAIENIEAGKLTPLAVFSEERIEYLPDVPTAIESGVDVSVSQYRFLTVPAGTPQEVQDTLVQGLQATFATPEYQEFNAANSLTPLELPGDEVETLLQEDVQRYADLVQEYGIDLAGS